MSCVILPLCYHRRLQTVYVELAADQCCVQSRLKKWNKLGPGVFGNSLSYLYLAKHNFTSVLSVLQCPQTGHFAVLSPPCCEVTLNLLTATKDSIVQ